MAVHVYENGAEGGTDGTEVNVLQFDGGILATGQQKNVIKTFALRTDGEVLKDMVISAAILDETDLTKQLQRCFEIERESSFKDFMYVTEKEHGKILIKQLDGTNKNIKITAYVYQKDGICDTQAKIRIMPLSETVEVVSNV